VTDPAVSGPSTDSTAETVKGRPPTNTGKAGPLSLIGLLLMAWYARKRHRGFRYWVLYRGLPFAVAVVVLYTANGFLNGWAKSYDLLVGIGSPTGAEWRLPAWALSIAGWLFVPGLAGAVAGYIVTEFIANWRTRPLDSLFNPRDDDA
jgi:Family of unknown function (DUF6313)